MRDTGKEADMRDKVLDLKRAAEAASEAATAAKSAFFTAALELAESLSPYKPGDDIRFREYSNREFVARVKRIDTAMGVFSDSKADYVLIVELLTKAGKVAGNRNPIRVYPSYIIGRA
jgi:hypothetical protein